MSPLHRIFLSTAHNLLKWENDFHSPRRVADVMTYYPYTLGPQDDLTALYTLFFEKDVRYVPIIDDEQNFLGLVSYDDLLRLALIGQAHPPFITDEELLEKYKATKYMTKDPETTRPDTPIQEAAQALLDNQQGCLPVLEGKRLIGILTEADFVRYMANHYTDDSFLHDS